MGCGGSEAAEQGGIRRGADRRGRVSGASCRPATCGSEQVTFHQGSGKAGGVAKNTAVGAGVGAASGAVGGAISGSPGLGSAIGAASGAVWGLLMGLFNAGSSHPSQAYTNYVNRCLQDKGYEVTGWQ